MKNSISFDSSLSKFGIGVFETIKIINGKCISLDKHLKRMYNSIKELNIAFEVNEEILKKEILNCAENIENKALRVTICDEGYNFSLRDITYKKEDYEKGFNINISPIVRGKSILYKHKTTNYFESIYSKKYAVDNGFDEALFINTKNKILEGSMTNIFFIKDNMVYTPDKNLDILPGVMREEIINILKNLNIKVIETELDLNDIKNFEFCFISNSLMDVMRINSIEDIRYQKEHDIFTKIEFNLKENLYGYKSNI